MKDELTNEKFEVIQGWGNKDLVIKGWALKPDATKPDYSVGSLIKDSNIFEHLNEKSRVKVYAVWGKAGYTVTYHSNGGSVLWLCRIWNMARKQNYTIITFIK